MWNLFVWRKGIVSRQTLQCGSESVVRHWWLWKESVMLCSNLNAMQATSQQVFTVCVDTRFQSFFSQRLIASSTTFCRNSAAAVATRPYRGLVLGIHDSAPDAVINRVYVTTVGWPHVRTDELGCLPAQKLECVTSAMCWCIFLVKTNTFPMLRIVAATLASVTCTSW